MNPSFLRCTLLLGTLLAPALAQACELTTTPVPAATIAQARAALDRPMVMTYPLATDIREIAGIMQRLSGVCIDLAPSVGQSVPRFPDGRVPEGMDLTPPALPASDATSPGLSTAPPVPADLTGRLNAAARSASLVHDGIDRTPLFVPGLVTPRRPRTLRGLLNALSSEVGARWWFDPRNGNVLMADDNDPVWGAVWSRKHGHERASTDVAGSKGAPRATTP